MKLKTPFKELALIFAAALAVYLAAYFLIEYRRERLGPWKVTFSYRSDASPLLIINQPALAISNVSIAFMGTEQTNSFTNETTLYGTPKPVPYATPFGQCVFMDTTFQPGTIVFKTFGHEIQLIPRVLTIDGQERSWHSGDQISLAATNTTLNRTNTP